jgi:hypothetical protein
MVKPDGKYPSKVQMDAQRLLHELLKASSHYDRIEYFGGVDKLGGASLVQKAAADKAAIKRCIEILRAANSDDEWPRRSVSLRISSTLSSRRARYSEEGVASNAGQD